MVYENRCVVVTEAGSYLRLIDCCITQLKAQGPSRTCNESKEEEEGVHAWCTTVSAVIHVSSRRSLSHSRLPQDPAPETLARAAKVGQPHLRGKGSLGPVGSFKSHDTRTPEPLQRIALLASFGDRLNGV